MKLHIEKIYCVAENVDPELSTPRQISNKMDEL